MKTKTVLFAVGGTGGHLFPALSVADSLKHAKPDLCVFFAGGGLKNDKYFENSLYHYDYVSSAPLTFRQPLKFIKNSFTIFRGWRESCRLLENKSVSMVVGFGSYYSLPLLLAAKWRRVPYVLHEQNTIPGKVIRLFSGGAEFTGIHFPESSRYLKGDLRNVGMPLRTGYKFGKITKEDAKKYYGLDKNKPVLLIFGGSQGALGINKMLFEEFQKKQSVSYQILHFTGSSNETERFQSLYHDLGICCFVKDYEDKMEFAWAAADCVVSRAGASSIAEQIEFEVPGVLVPYPYGMDNHQEFNADFFVRDVEGGVKFLQKLFGEVSLLGIVNKVMQPAELQRLKQNIARYKKRTHTKNFASEILDYLKTIR